MVHKLLEDEGTDLQFRVNGKLYNRYYLLADGIYPPWACFVLTIHFPSDEKGKQYFNETKEACVASKRSEHPLLDSKEMSATAPLYSSSD